METNNNDEVNEECEQDAQSSVGYWTRSKRRRLSNIEEGSNTDVRDAPERKRKNPIMFVPLEILTVILKKISYKELGLTVRLVNRRFKIVVENLMNCTFKNIEHHLIAFKKSTEISLAYTQDDLEIKNLSEMLSMLDLLQMQYNVLYATIWRYVYNDFYKATIYCMYGGQIIDAFQEFIYKFIHSPQQCDAVKIVQMTKLFCLHFDRVNEEPTVNCLLDSGCKMIDIMDCAKFIDRKVVWENCNNNFYSAQYIYFFRNSWFIALPIKPTKDSDPSQKQRMMHMRLRRIVLAHNDMFLAQTQYERDIILRPAAHLTLKKPSNNVYTGYGDAGDIFFYYGVMNEGAYIQKFNIEEDTDNDELDEEQVLVQNNANNPPVRNDNSEEDILYQLSHLGFRVVVNLKCPVSYAPWEYVRKLDSVQFQTTKRIKKKKEMTTIKMAFECLGASYPRLPSLYQYEFCPGEF